MGEPEIRKAAMGVLRVDTHGHLQGPIQDLESAAVKPADLDSAHRAAPGRIAAAGCEALYGIPVGPVLTADAPAEVFRRAREFRAGTRQEVFARTFAAAGIETQLCFCDFTCSDADAKRAIAPHVRLLAYLDLGVLGKPEKGDDYVTALERLHGPLRSLDDLLAIIDRTIDGWRARGVVGMKVSLAYHDHGLDLRNLPAAEAERAFARREAMSAEDGHGVRDFLARHAFDACLRNGLPVVFHTGFQAFGQANIMAANPALLHPVLSDPRWKDLTFVLLHGGYPYTGETTFLAARLPNVVIDFTWLSWLSPTRFRAALAEWIENVPFSRFVWGADSSACPERIVGIDRVSRSLIADVLEGLVGDGLLDRERALRFIELCYHANARRIFGLPPRQ